MAVAEAELSRFAVSDAPLMRFSAKRYVELTRIGVFGPEDKIELINGFLVEKMPQNDAHIVIVDIFSEIFMRALPPEWTARCQFGVRLSSSTIPEPDVAIVPGPKSQYRRRKPGPKEIALVIEVAECSLRYDRTTKKSIYARDRIPVYWIVNIPDETVEVYTEPRAGRVPIYRTQIVFPRGTRVPVILNGKLIAEVEVDELFV